MRMKRVALRVAAATALCAAIGLAGWAFVEARRPYKGFDQPVLLEFARGARTADLAASLVSRGVVPTKWHFLLVRALRRSEVLMAGEYRFAEPASPWEVYDRIARGDVYLRRLTIPEGLTRFEISKLIGESGYATEEEFLALTGDPSPVHDKFPEARNLEGFLYPETYMLPKTADGAQILAAMLANFRRAFERAHADTSLTPYQTLTLASLIEKETGIPAERPLVSAVFHNRLDRGMLLQCDPTIIYGLVLENRYKGRISTEDIADPHPYNTYIHAGLPPGPIASPGFGSLAAAFQPADTDYLFFVAKAEGESRHVFSESLSEHNEAVAKYRASRRGR